MGKIVAIGGGEFRKGGTRKIDEYIVALSGKKHPNLLFIPTASRDSENYMGSMKGYFGELGCYVECLCLVTETLMEEKIRQMILRSDIIYVGGGNTAYMMQIWKQFEVDQYLKEAYERGIILSGLSAGSICWFDSGYSDSAKTEKSGMKGLGWCEGLGLLPFYHCPHYDEPGRHEFDFAMAEKKGCGIALEKGIALSYVDGTYELIKNNNRRSGYLISQEEGGIIKQRLKNATLLNELYKNIK